MDDTVVLATVVGAENAKPGQDFFPLTVDYVEKFYAAGRIPGGFFKREGRPTEKEILTCRLIDRPLRPLFPDGFYNEVQIILHVLSSNPEVDSDIPAMIGASAALALSAHDARCSRLRSGARRWSGCGGRASAATRRARTAPGDSAGGAGGFRRAVAAGAQRGVRAAGGGRPAL
jgi:hypothetical protein